MDEGLDLKEIIKYIYKRKNILIYILLICIILAMFYTFLIKKPTYEVNAQILINKADASIADFIISRDLLIDSDMKVTFDKTSKIITISNIKTEAEQVVNETNNYIENLENKLTETYEINTFKIIQTPQLPTKANNINYIKDISTFLIGGIVLYVLYIIISINFTGIIGTSEIKVLGIKVLGNIKLEKAKGKKEKDSYITTDKETINELKRIEANIELNKDNKKPKTLLFTGINNRVGTSYITNNLANQYLKIYEKVLIIDADMFSKTLTNFYKKVGSKGLTNILKVGKKQQIDELIEKEGNIYFLPIGNENIEEDIFLKDTISYIIDELITKYDIILIDAPSINTKISTISLASITEAIIIIAQSEKTKQEEIVKAHNTIQNINGKISGVIINKS